MDERRGLFISHCRIAAILIGLGLFVPSFAVSQDQLEAQFIVTNQAGTSVFVDGTLKGVTVDDGTLAIYVAPGVHTIRLAKDGFSPISDTITIERASNEFTYTISEVGLVIRTGEAAVAVTVDGRPLGRTSADGTIPTNIGPGSHVFRLEKDGFETVSETHQVTDAMTDISIAVVPVGGGIIDRITPEVLLLLAMGSLCLILGTLLGVVVVRQRHPRSRRADFIPSTFDRYDVLRQLGRGGMATVYLATDRTAGENVALKVMDSSLLHDQDLVRKFVKEGEALQKISASSPRAPVVRALRYGREHNSESGRPFVALEYLEGTTLLNLLKQSGPLPVRHVLVVARQVAEGLTAAHAHGIWHRDISPDNVFMTGEDYHGPTVKLIDFGVAKHEFTQIHTLDGSIAGKPAYMSPEQCRGEAVDGRTDLYSVGVMMYTLLTGHPPFTDQNPLIVMKLHENAPPPPLPQSVPQPVASLVYRLLNKNPNDRPSSAAELAVEIYALERMN